MRFCRYTVFAVLVLLAGLASMSWADETPTAQALPDTLNLYYKYAPNEVVRYAINQHIMGTQTNPGKESSNIDVEISAIIKLECIQVYDDGSWDLRVTMESASMKSDGKPVKDYSPSKDVFIIPFNKQGSMNMVSLDFGSVEFMPFILLLPEKPIPSGQNWSVDLPLSAMLCRAHMEYSAVSVKDDLYTIKLNINTKTVTKDDKAKTDSTASAPPANLEEGSAEIILDQNAGKLVSSKGVISSTVSAIVAGASKKKGEKIGTDDLSTTKLDCRFTMDMIK